jgi:hypothetical protein
VKVARLKNENGIVAMKLPNAENAIVDIGKIRDYCLSQEHPRGRHKARVFESVFGMTDADSEELWKILKAAAIQGNASPGVSDQFGDRYTIDFSLERNGRTATIRSCWIVLSGGRQPRFVTCFIV